MKNLLVFVIVLIMTAFQANAQNNHLWNGRNCAVVLTYDDAIDQHLDNAVPILDSLGLKATFYITAFSTSMQTRQNEWKKLAIKGHELGNHTLYHPCIGNTPGREWVRPEYDLSKYTVQRMLDEVRMTNTFLKALDGKKKRTFAYTCGDMKIGDSSFIEPLKNEFIAARGVRSVLNRMPSINLYNVDCFVVNGETGEQLIGWVKQAEATGSLLVILFHGVNGGNSLNVSLEAHSELLHYLKQKEQSIWITPMIEIAEFVKQQ
jgi:sialate O-acetylesterase